MSDQGIRPHPAFALGHDLSKDWGALLRDIASDLAGIKGQKKYIKVLLDGADLMDRAPPAARYRIAQALRIRHPKLTALPPINQSIYGDQSERLTFSPYPNVPLQWQAEVVLGKTPAELTGLTAREAHECFSAKAWRIPARWLLRDLAIPDDGGAMLSIRTVPIARWYLQRWNDPAQKEALMKEHVERGPAGEEIRGRFIDRMDELEESDLTPSVRKTFENASNRLRIEFEKEMLSPKNQQLLAPVPAWYTEQPGITLLDHGAQLVMEGREMSHCVATYIGKVRKGWSTILGIRVPTEDGQVLRSTVELNPTTAEVIQHKGVGNAAPPPENTKVLGHALEVWLNPTAAQHAADFAAAEHERRGRHLHAAGDAAAEHNRRDMHDERARQGNPVPADLHDRIARDLGWPVADTYKFSLPTLRELVRDYELKGDITQALIEGRHLTSAAPERRRR